MMGNVPFMYARWSLARGDANGARASRIALRRLIEDADVNVPMDEVDVVLGELASNAVRYGGDPMSIVVTSHDGLLEICTFDWGPGYDPDRTAAIDPLGESGRGLAILRAFSEHVSVHRDDAGMFCVCVAIAVA